MTADEYYYVYMLECSGERFYTGITDDPARRIAEHCSGKAGAKFTRSFKPQTVVCCWRIGSGKGDALRIEQFIKNRKKHEKIDYVNHPARIKKDLERNIGLYCDIKPCNKNRLKKLNTIIQNENRN